MPFMSPSGNHWRCWIGPESLFYRNHGAYLKDSDFSDTQSQSLSARYTSGEENHYFGWTDAKSDDARSLADKFVVRFGTLATRGEGWSYNYAGWYQRLLVLAVRGWLPVVISDDDSSSLKKVDLFDLRPPEWRAIGDSKAPSLPLPPAGKLFDDLR